MQFTEIGFALFFAVVFAVYWLILRRRHGLQNLFLLTMSYLFYGWWDWRFLGLIILTTVTTYASALMVGGRWGKAVTTANIVVNLGVLIAFKYFNFFSENIQRLLSVFGWQMDWFSIDVLLPVGISFYTFQAISYSVDVYKGNVPACKNPLTFATFIAYFPQLVAGPIERASQLLPQIASVRRWDYGRAVDGARMLLFGVLKKVCVADMLAIYVDRLYAAESLGPVHILVAGVLFSLEIYCDFSAYSEIARGVSRMLGIELMANFRFPYFSRNILEFWQRWHISLMWWFRDYVYIPLGGSRRGITRTCVNIAIVFFLSGLWHGASWNFVVWGVYWAVVYVFGRVVLKLSKPSLPIEIAQLPQMVYTFGVVAFGFYLFRCADSARMLAGLKSVWIYPVVFGLVGVVVSLLIKWFRCLRFYLYIGVMMVVAVIVMVLLGWWVYMLKFWWLLPAGVVAIVEWHCRNTDYPLSVVPRRTMVRWGFYWLCMLLILLSEPTDVSFIYFQF